MIAGFSREEILHEVLVAPRAAIVPLADTRIIERPGFWQLVTPSIKQGGMNDVSCTELPDDADRIIDETIAFYRELGVRFRWMIRPDTRPDDLAERLARRGMHRSESLAMARATGGGVAREARAVTVEEVSVANVDDFTRVMAEGWEIDPAPLDDLHRRTLAHPARAYHLFLARDGGLPAGVGSYAALPRSAYLIGAVVLPRSRGRGLYSALVNARLRHAGGRGLALATTLARAETSAPILERLGFESVSSIPVFMSG